MNNKCYIRQFPDSFEVVSYNFEEYDKEADTKYNKDGSLYYGIRVACDKAEPFYAGGVNARLVSEMEISSKLFHSIMGFLSKIVNIIDDRCQIIVGNRNRLHVPGATNYFIEYDGPSLTLNHMRSDNKLYTEYQVVLNEGFIYSDISNEYEEPYPFEFGGDEIYFIDQLDYYEVVAKIKNNVKDLYELVESIFEIKNKESRPCERP